MDGTNLFRGTLVRLAAPSPEDARAIAHWSNDSEYLRQADTDYARPLSVDEVASGYGSSSSHSVRFRIRTLADDLLIGLVSLFNIEWHNGACQLAIGIGEADYRSRGYGTDALRVTLRYAFDELNLYRVGLDVISYNVRAIKAYEKVGFRHEGAWRGAVLRDGKRSDRLFMGILRDEWLEVLRGSAKQNGRDDDAY